MQSIKLGEYGAFFAEQGDFVVFRRDTLTPQGVIPKNYTGYATGRSGVVLDEIRGRLNIWTEIQAFGLVHGRAENVQVSPRVVEVVA